MKAEALARPIAVMEPAMNKGGKKRPFPPAQEVSAEKKPKTSFVTREGLPAIPRLVIDLTSSKREKNEATRSELVTHVVPKVASLIANRIAQRRGSVMSLVLKFVPKRDSPAAKKEVAHLGNCEKSTKPISREAACNDMSPKIYESALQGKYIDFC